MTRPKRNFKYYIAELMILVLGISLSFILNEWRQQRAEDKMEEELLIQFRDNLILDSLSLSVQLQSLDLRMKAASHLLMIDDKTPYNDSTARNLIFILNFGGFQPADIAYQEMRSQGTSHLVQNKELLQEMIQLYGADYDRIQEWSEADKVFLMNDLMPHMNKKLPFARRFNFGIISSAKQRQLMKALMEDEMRYMIQYNEVLKMGNKQVFELAMGEVRRIIGMLNEELPEASVLGELMKQED